jgi:hypothetical protein
VIPREINYQKLVVSVRLGTRERDPVAVSAIHRDDKNDLALLELMQQVDGVGGADQCPMPVMDDAKQAPMGTHLVLLGYPLDRDFSVVAGVVSNHGIPSKGELRWDTGVIMNPGNSGGPAFNAHGALIGIAEGGIVNWVSDGETRPVYGVSLIIPTTVILKSPLFDMIKALPSDSKCWTSFEDVQFVSANGSFIPGWKDLKTVPSGSVNKVAARLDTIFPIDDRQSPFVTDVPVSALKLPERLIRSYPFAETKSDHPVLLAESSRNYTKRYAADSGYTARSCEWRAESSNHSSNEVCNVIEGGKAVEFSFTLTSGPASDQWRGWLLGSLNVVEEKDGLTQLAPDKQRMVRLSETKDDHPSPFKPDKRSYTKKYDADPGYVIKGCEWQAESQNRADGVECSVGADGGAATFKYNLSSGPAVDRWRGWIEGTITLKQQRSDIAAKDRK